MPSLSLIGCVCKSASMRATVLLGDVHGAVLSTISSLGGAWRMSPAASMGKVISYSRAATMTKMLSHGADTDRAVQSFMITCSCWFGDSFYWNLMLESVLLA